MTPLLSAELYKLSRRPACRVLALTGAGVILVFYLMMAVLMAQEIDTASRGPDIEALRDMTALRNSMIFGYGITQFIASILGIILMSLAITSEYGWRTVLTTTTWTGERGRVLSARMLVVLGFLAIGVALGWLMAAVGSVTVGAVNGDLAFDGVDAGFAGSVAAGWWRTWLTVAVYALLAAAFSSISRSVAVAIGAAMMIRFLEPVGVEFLSLLPAVFGSLQNLLISPNVDALLQANGVLETAEQPARELPSTFQATIYLIGFCIMSGTVAVLSFIRRDIDV